MKTNEMFFCYIRYYDCKDKSDEEGCPAGHAVCDLGQFRCADGQKCISQYQKCNHRKECDDGSDEDGCDFPPCHSGQFRYNDNTEQLIYFSRHMLRFPEIFLKKSTICISSGVRTTFASR